MLIFPAHKYSAATRYARSVFCHKDCTNAASHKSVLLFTPFVYAHRASLCLALPLALPSVASRSSSRKIPQQFAFGIVNAHPKPYFKQIQIEDWTNMVSQYHMIKRSDMSTRRDGESSIFAPLVSV